MSRKQAFSYKAKLEALGPLEEFAPMAFLEDAEHPAPLCRFVLALAVVHNDMNDIDLAVTLLKTQQPPTPVRRNREWAIFNSLGLHLAKMRIALVHELMNLIRSNSNVFLLPGFKKLLKSLSARDRSAWNEVMQAAKGDPRSSELGKFLAHCRDKAANHYDAKVLHAAYRERFSDPGTCNLVHCCRAEIRCSKLNSSLLMLQLRKSCWEGCTQNKLTHFFSKKIRC